MIEKLRRIQESWVMKVVLGITALSFMSLFGVSSYVSQIGKNKPVVEVGDKRIYMSDILTQFRRDITAMQYVFGGNLDEKAAVSMGLFDNTVKNIISRAIVENASDDMGMSISDDAIRARIFSTPDFQDKDGKFDRRLFNTFLDRTGWNETQYIEAYRSDIKRDHVLRMVATEIYVPNILAENVYKKRYEKRTANVIVVNASDMKISTSPSEDELKAYYEDNKASYMIPELRSASIMVLTPDELLKTVEVSDSEVDALYNKNMGEYATPEKRSVNQMLFDEKDKSKADEAYKKLQAGEGFVKVASEVAGQSEKDTSLGLVGKDELIAESGEKVFSLSKGAYTAPFKSQFGWHIMQVVDVQKATKQDEKVVKAKLLADLKLQKAYDGLYGKAREVKDALGAGEKLEAIATKFNLPIIKINNVSYDDLSNGKAYNKEWPQVIKNSGLAGEIYNGVIGENSNLVETEGGMFMVRLDDIKDAEPKSLDTVKASLVKMWQKDEELKKTGEISAKIKEEIEKGASFADVATKYGLKSQTITLTHFDTDKLDATATARLFTLDKGEVDKVPTNDGYVVVRMTKSESPEPNQKEIANIKETIKKSEQKDFASSLIMDLSTRFKVKIDKAQIEDYKKGFMQQ